MRQQCRNQRKVKYKMSIKGIHTPAPAELNRQKGVLFSDFENYRNNVENKIAELTTENSELKSKIEGNLQKSNSIIVSWMETCQSKDDEIRKLKEENSKLKEFCSTHKLTESELLDVNDNLENQLRTTKHALCIEKAERASDNQKLYIQLFNACLANYEDVLFWEREERKYLEKAKEYEK